MWSKCSYCSSDPKLVEKCEHELNLLTGIESVAKIRLDSSPFLVCGQNVVIAVTITRGTGWGLACGNVCRASQNNVLSRWQGLGLESSLRPNRLGWRMVGVGEGDTLK